MREVVNKTSSDMIYMVYDLEPNDMHLRNWLHEGLSHEITQVFQVTFSDALRPLMTRCGMAVTARIEKKQANLYNLVDIATTCVWCMAERSRHK